MMHDFHLASRAHPGVHKVLVPTVRLIYLGRKRKAGRRGRGRLGGAVPARQRALHLEHLEREGGTLVERESVVGIFVAVEIAS